MSSIPRPDRSPADAPPPAPSPPAKPKPEEPDRAFYAEARARRTRLIFHFRTGQQLAGFVCAFGRYSVTVDSSHGRVIVYKHGVDMVEIDRASAPRSAPPGPKPAPDAPGPLRPPVGNAR